MNNNEINSLLYTSDVYKILGINKNENIILLTENTENIKIICLDLSLTESAYIKRNFQLFIEKLEIFLYLYNNYSNNTFNSIWFGFFELNWNKYWNTIYIFNLETNNFWYKKINSLWMNKDQNWNILKLYRINSLLKNNTTKNTNNNCYTNFKIIYDLIINKDLSVRNLMKYFNQPASREIFNILKENKIFEIDKLNHNEKYYFINRLDNIEKWLFEKYKKNL